MLHTGGMAVLKFDTPVASPHRGMPVMTVYRPSLVTTYKLLKFAFSNGTPLPHFKSKGRDYFQ